MNNIHQVQGLPTASTVNGETAGWQSPPVSLDTGEGSIVTRSQPLSQSTPPPSLNLHIDHLILHGFSALDRDRIGSAVQAELTRLFVEQGIPRSLLRGAAINQLDGVDFAMVAGTPPRIIGTRIARAIYRGLSHE